MQTDAVDPDSQAPLRLLVAHMQMCSATLTVRITTAATPAPPPPPPPSPPPSLATVPPLLATPPLTITLALTAVEAKIANGVEWYRGQDSDLIRR